MHYKPPTPQHPVVKVAGPLSCTCARRTESKEGLVEESEGWKAEIRRVWYSARGWGPGYKDNKEGEGDGKQGAKEQRMGRRDRREKGRCSRYCRREKGRVCLTAVRWCAQGGLPEVAVALLAAQTLPTLAASMDAAAWSAALLAATSASSLP